MSTSGGKIIKFCKKNPQIFVNNFSRVMEGLESKRKRLNIDDGEGHVVD
jgi:hypothetical protein